MTPPYRHPADGRIHFSTLKHIAQSPKHYAYHATHPREPTPAMLLGSAVDSLVFGGRPVTVYAGRRAGKDWDAFAAERAGHLILNVDENERVAGAVAALRASPVAAPYLRGEFQKTAQWDAHGLQFATGIPGERGGFDVLAPCQCDCGECDREEDDATSSLTLPHKTTCASLGGVALCDLKITTTVEPAAWQRQCTRMHYAEQLVHYRYGARAIGYDVRELVSVGVEIQPPHDVVVMRPTEREIATADRTLRLWYERLRACEESGQWPGCAQSVVEWERPSWGLEDVGGD